MPGLLTFKAIKPAKLNDKAMREQLRHALERAGRQYEKDLKEPTQTWEKPVVFKVHTSVIKGANGIMVEVETDDEIYRYVNDGTKPHDIWAGIYTGKSDKKVLAFASAFLSKTKPGSTQAGAGSRGETDTFRPYVRHPGTKPRDFVGQVMKRRAKWFQEMMQEAMRSAVQASGHSK